MTKKNTNEETAKVADEGAGVASVNPQPVYAVVANDTEEFQLSLRYAARLAQKDNAHVGIIYVIDEGEFHHWGGVESMMQDEMRKNAETFLWEMAKKINDLNKAKPVFYIAEGAKEDAIVETINNDPSIKTVILSAKASSSGPGPLVSYFTGKGLGKLPVPLTLVPGNMLPHKIDSNLGIASKHDE